MTVKAIDLFAGAGGFTLSAIEAGVDVIAAVEFDKSAAETYRKNFIEGKKRKIELRSGPQKGDINNITPLELRQSLELERGELDIILGGPPCQGFSTHRIKNAGVDDPRNALLLKYFEFVHEFQPKAFLVENVTGLLWKRHEKYFHQFIDLAQNSHYTLKFSNIINAVDYGVPQNRKRVFIFGIHEDLNNSTIKFPPKPTHHSPNSGVEPFWIPASSVFEDIPSNIKKRYIDEYFVGKFNLSEEEGYNILNNLPIGEPVSENEIFMNPTPKLVERFMDTPLNGSRVDAGEKHLLKCHSNGYEGHKDVYGRIMIHRPSNTITTGCNNPSKGRFVHPWKNHGITLRHAARLQTFPDWFEFTGSSTHQAKQIGNAVPPKLGETLIRSICQILKK
ncbi:cytosine methyltransferase [Pectobacterium brasiliense]|uniref:DNA cytosine methyltransferase n=1 Tax=Pectobacterium brasiliense TaxID=180957 RepID=UPI0001A43826|nr:DNA cytosine methyltransferase [Pectobacterium brasiliense]KGA23594.1 cytosine methyltransferase [Pectobacterium brasiliense]KRF67041.1 cytosine methyltransferase [Pectobacterium brasiliense]MBN3185540.1 DNA cytosine methyltransferase [Pectobacterium brasiliense]QHG30302.1 DNA (cytosine-5-)-methyltransferase [Pectobacterium brasiliense]